MCVMQKFNVNFSDSTYEVLKELAARLDVNLADVIREALSLLWWVATEYSQGHRFLIQRGDRTTEVEFPSLILLRRS